MSIKASLTKEQAKKLQPRNNHVLVELMQTKGHETATGIVIPSGDKEQSLIGKVINVGPGTMNENGTLIPISNLKQDDKVILSQYAGTKIHAREAGVEHTFVLVKDIDILGVIKD